VDLCGRSRVGKHYRTYPNVSFEELKTYIVCLAADTLFSAWQDENCDGTYMLEYILPPPRDSE
jgi:hypothetical protein